MTVMLEVGVEGAGWATQLAGWVSGRVEFVGRGEDAPNAATRRGSCGPRSRLPALNPAADAPGDHHNELLLKRKGQGEASFESHGDFYLCQKQSFLLFLWRIEAPSVSSLTLHGVAVAGLV